MIAIVTGVDHEEDCCSWRFSPCLEASGQDTLKTTNIQRYYTPVRLFLLGAAEVMPDDKHDFKIAPEQMDFGQWINHATERNYVDCSTLRGEPNLLPKAKTDQLTGKADISRALGSRSITVTRRSPRSTIRRSRPRRR